MLLAERDKYWGVGKHGASKTEGAGRVGGLLPTRGSRSSTAGNVNKPFCQNSAFWVRLRLENVLIDAGRKHQYRVVAVPC